MLAYITLIRKNKYRTKIIKDNRAEVFGGY